MKVLAAVIAAMAAAWFLADRAGGKNNDAIDVALIEANLVGGYLVNNAVVQMRLSESSLMAIAGREGFSANKYVDASGYSIGYGHFIQAGESFAEPMSKAQAYGLLLADTGIAQKAVSAYVTVPISQAQFDALVSFVYNVGAGNFKKSSVLTRLNAGDYIGAAGWVLAYNKSGGVVLAALDRRRADEYAQFMG